MQLLDFAAAQIDPQAIRNAGYDGIVAYVSQSRPGTNFGNKPLTREYADSLRAAGLQVVSNYQFGKPGDAEAPSDYTRGFAGGVADAQTAVALHEAAGGPPEAPIMFSVDDDITLDDWNSVAVQWFRGINSVLGVARTGIYGHSRACAWAIQDGVVGVSTTNGKFWVWQTIAWSNGQTEPAAVLLQSVVDTAAHPGPVVGGVSVDVDDVLADDFGQWDLARPPAAAASPAAPARGAGIVTAAAVVPAPAPAAAVAPPPAPAVSPISNEVNEIGESPNCGPRTSNSYGDHILWFLLHTQEGGDPANGAQGLANFLQREESQVSYHYTVDNSGTVIDVVDTDLESWSVLDANPRAINLCFAGSLAAWSRQDWFDNMQRGIDCAAYLAVQDCHKYDLPTHTISPAELGELQKGIADHNAVTVGLGIGDHTDVGPGFPWDYFSSKLDEFSGVPGPAVSA
jgi:hypothetical protein